MIKNLIKKKGFTTVEMMVSVALFSVVVLVCISSLMVTIDANKKARGLKIAMDNLNFLIEDMSRDIRLGSKYFCSVTNPTSPVTIGGNVNDCYYSKNETMGGGGSYLAFRDREGNAVIYRFNPGGYIEQKITNAPWSSYVDNVTGYTRITSPDILVNNLRFYVFNTAVDSGQQPFVAITIKGTVGQSLLQTRFTLVTSVAQRILHNAE